MKIGFYVFILVAILATSGMSQAPTKLKPKGKPADEWLASLRKANEGKWNEVLLLTGPLRFMSAAAQNALPPYINGREGTDCQRAAANLGYSAASDNYLKGSFEEMSLVAGKAVYEMVEAMSPPNTLKKLIKEAIKKGAEVLGKYILERLAKEKAEVHITKTTRENCQLVLVSIWDKAASSYELIIYGECKCTSQKCFSIRDTVVVDTFEIRLTGKIYIDVDETNESLKLKAGDPKVTIKCDECKNNDTNGPAPKPPVTTTPPPKPPPPATPTPTPRKEPVSQSPCKPSPPCKECMEFYEPIVAGCDRIKEIDTELVQLEFQLKPFGERKTNAEKELAQLQQKSASVQAISAKRAQLQALEKQVNEFVAQSKKLRAEQAKLETERKNLTGQMKNCEKTRCGTGTKTTTGGNTAGKLDRCLIGTWRSEPGTYGSSQVGSFYMGDMLSLYNNGGLMFIVNNDGSAIFDYAQLKESINKNRYGGESEDTFETAKASGKSTAIIGTRDDLIEVRSNRTLNVTLKLTYTGYHKYSPREAAISDFFPNERSLTNFTCSGNILTLGTIKFKKVE